MGRGEERGWTDLLTDEGAISMGTRMKTTIELSDALLAEARSVAASDGTTLRALVEEGLRACLHRRKTKPRFRLRDASFRGTGLQEPFSDADWSAIRAAAYEGRGS